MSSSFTGHFPQHSASVVADYQRYKAKSTRIPSWSIWTHSKVGTALARPRHSSARPASQIGEHRDGCAGQRRGRGRRPRRRRARPACLRRRRRLKIPPANQQPNNPSGRAGNGPPVCVVFFPSGWGVPPVEASAETGPAPMERSDIACPRRTARRAGAEAPGNPFPGHLAPAISRSAR